MHDPRVPETLEGWSVLHQMFRVRWDAWTALPDAPFIKLSIAQSDTTRPVVSSNSKPTSA